MHGCTLSEVCSPFQSRGTSKPIKLQRYFTHVKLIHSNVAKWQTFYHVRMAEQHLTSSVLQFLMKKCLSLQVKIGHDTYASYRLKVNLFTRTYSRYEIRLMKNKCLFFCHNPTFFKDMQENSSYFLLSTSCFMLVFAFHLDTREIVFPLHLFFSCPSCWVSRREESSWTSSWNLTFFLPLTFSHSLWLSSRRYFDSVAYLVKEWLSTCVALLFICCFYGSLLPWSFDRLTC